MVRYFSMTQRPFHMGVLCDDFTASVCSASADMLASSPLIDARIAASLSAFSFELQTCTQTVSAVRRHCTVAARPCIACRDPYA